MDSRSIIARRVGSDKAAMFSPNLIHNRMVVDFPSLSNVEFAIPAFLFPDL